MEEEWAQVEKFIKDSLKKPHYYIFDGMLEPVRLSQKERDILVKGFEDTLNKSMHEINRSQKLYNINAGRPSEALIEYKKDLENLTREFQEQAKTKPWIFSKCSIHGLYITKQCLSNIREDSQRLLQQEMHDDYLKLRN